MISIKLVLMVITDYCRLQRKVKTISSRFFILKTNSLFMLNFSENSVFFRIFSKKKVFIVYVLVEMDYFGPHREVNKISSSFSILKMIRLFILKITMVIPQ